MIEMKVRRSRTIRDSFLQQAWETHHPIATTHRNTPIFIAAIPETPLLAHYGFDIGVFPKVWLVDEEIV